MKTHERLVGLASLAGLVIFGASLKAQAPAPAAPKKIYTQKTSFRLPVAIKDPAERARLADVQLYVKAGGAMGTWSLNQKAKPNADHFDYQVPQDGEYWFRLVTVDTAGHMNPPDIAQAVPSLVVVVDTKKPECEVKAVQGGTGELILQCEVKDENPDPTRTKLEYVSPDKGWQPLAAHPVMPGCFQVVDLAILKNPVRATACDRAGNQCTREFSVTPQGQSATPAAPLTQVMNPAPMPAMPTPVAPAPLTQTVGMAAPMPTETTSEKPAAPADNTPIIYVKNKHVPMEYQAEGTLAKVVLWATVDGGHSWVHLAEDADKKSPVEVDFPGEGRYGVCVSACATEADCKAPAKGTTPDCWVEVDSTLPTASLIAVRPGAAKDEVGTLLITWTASDKNLKAEPIDLYYAAHAEGPWQPIAKGVKNDGNYRWRYSADLSGAEVFVRMEVTDKAGNMTDCKLGQPPAEASRPRAKVLGVAGMPHAN